VLAVMAGTLLLALAAECRQGMKHAALAAPDSLGQAHSTLASVPSGQIIAGADGFPAWNCAGHQKPEPHRKSQVLPNHIDFCDAVRYMTIYLVRSMP